MADRIEKLVAQIVREMLDEKGRINIDDVVSETRARHADAIKEDADRLIDNALHKAAARILKALSRDEDEPEQLTLHGLAFPTAIFVRTEDGGYYVDSRYAVEAEVLAGEQERVDNVDAAMENLRVYRESAAIILPYMKGHPRRTVEYAYRLAKKDGKL